MTRSPLVLAALASAAVPGLDPVSVEGVRVHEGDLYELAHVQDSEDRRWVVRAPRTQAAGAMLEDVASLASLLDRRLDVAVPVVRGLAVVPEGRAAVYPHLPGLPLDFAALPPGELAAEVGRVLAHIHNIEHLLFDEAGRPVYDAEAHRRRQLSELDRAAATGRVPTALLTRWERVVEDVALWRFAPTPVHGSFTGAHVLAAFDEDDASAGHVRALLAWEESRIGDPADDFAELCALASPEALADVLEAYTQSRVDRPDPHLARRARLAAELTPVRMLLRAHASGERRLLDAAAEELRRLDERLSSESERAWITATSSGDRETDAPSPSDEGIDEAAAVLPATEGGVSGSAADHPDELAATSDASALPVSGSNDENIGQNAAQDTDHADQGTDQTDDWAGTHGPRRVVTHHGATQLVPVGRPSAEPTDEQSHEQPHEHSDEQSHELSADERSTATRSEEPTAPPASESTAQTESRSTAVESPGTAERPTPLPDGDLSEAEGDGVLDLHEGASEFVPVDRRMPRRADD